MTQHPVHRSLVAVDIEGYSGRDNPGQIQLRTALRRVLDDALDAVGIELNPAERQDQGDAFLQLVSPEIAKPVLVDGLVRAIENGLRRRNRYEPSENRMRLRVAVHAGEVHLDGTGYPGEATVAVMRLLDSAYLRQALTVAPKDLAVIVSGSFYDDVVAHGYDSIDPREYRRVEVEVKTFRKPAWVRVPGLPAAQIFAGTGDPAATAEPAQAPGRAADAAPESDTHYEVLRNARFTGTTRFDGPLAGRDVTIHHK